MAEARQSLVHTQTSAVALAVTLPVPRKASAETMVHRIEVPLFAGDKVLVNGQLQVGTQYACRVLVAAGVFVTQKGYARKFISPCWTTNDAHTTFSMHLPLSLFAEFTAPVDGFYAFEVGGHCACDIAQSGWSLAVEYGYISVAVFSEHPFPWRPVT